MKRYLHGLNSTKLLSMNMGKLVPINLTEVLPGDTFRGSTSALIRVSPLVNPVMHSVHVTLHHWFVPHRLVWDDFEDFITGGPDGENNSVAPTITTPVSTGFAVGSLADYLGVPPGVASQPISALPFRGYQLIFSENYRDEDLVTAPTISTASGSDTTTTLTLQDCAWEKDYFTTSRLSPAKGPDVTIPLGDKAPVSGFGVNTSETFPSGPTTMKDASTTNAGVSYPNYAGITNFVVRGTGPGATSVPDVYADLAEGTGPTAIEFRRAMAIQRFEEWRSRYGSRYTEMLRSDFGTVSADARLQRPEYIGGGKNTLQFSEVLQTAPDVEDGTSDNTGVGSLKGHGIGGVKSNRFKYHATEFGFIYTLMYVRPKTVYMNGLPRHWSRPTKFDYFNPHFAHIGQQAVLNKEAMFNHTQPNGTLGYNDRYDEYRRAESSVAGEFRTTLKSWHMGREFTSDIALNADFVEANPTTRIYQSTATDQLYVDAKHNLMALRVVPSNATPFVK